MCENGPVLAVELGGAAGGGPPLTGLLVRLGLFDVRPWIASQCQRSIFYGYDTHVDISLGLPFRKARHLRRDCLPCWRSLSGGEVCGRSFIEVDARWWIFLDEVLNLQFKPINYRFCEPERTREVLAKCGRSDAGLLGRYFGSTEWSVWDSAHTIQRPSSTCIWRTLELPRKEEAMQER